MRLQQIGASVLLVLSSALSANAQDTSLSKLPETVPGIPGLGESKSVGVFTQVGALTEGFKLQVPPGRKSLEPALSLLYTSGSGRDAGLGWTFEMGKVERSIRFDFTASISGANVNLVAVSPGQYRADNESTYRQFTQVGNHWEMYDAAGMHYFFGSSSSTQVADAVWMLDRIEDTNGNYLTVDYLQDSGWFYPSTIRYAGHSPSGLSPTNQVNVTYVTRTDPRVDYLAGYRREKHLLPSTVTASAGGSTVRTYELLYGNSGPSSVLTDINLVGAAGTRIKARNYAYSSIPAGWNGSQINGTLPYTLCDADGVDTGTRVLDINGDTFADVIDPNRNVWLGNGSGGFTLSSVWSDSLDAAGIVFVGANGEDRGIRLVDVNGDALPDLMVARVGATSQVFLNTGAGFALDPTFTTSLAGLSQTATIQERYITSNCNEATDPNPNPAWPNCDDSTSVSIPFSFAQAEGDSSGAFLADVNGDGLVDMVWNFKNTDLLFKLTPDGATDPLGRQPSFVQAVFLNNGSGWAPSSSLSSEVSKLSPFIIDSQAQGLDIYDVNGDGISDFVKTPANAADRAVYLGTGAGWVLDSNYTADIQAAPLFSIDGTKGTGLMPIDYDWDGLVDFIRADGTTTVAYHNTGLNLTYDADFTAQLGLLGVAFVDANGKSTGYSLNDVNGDGRPDLIRAQDGAGASSITMTTPGPAGFMVQASTAYGEVTQATYAPSSSFANDSNGIEGLPIVTYVVDSLTRFNGTQNFVSHFSYEGGLFSNLRMLGFGRVVMTDYRNVSTETENRQDSPFELRPSTVTIRDANGDIRKTYSYTYSVNAVATGVSQVLVPQTDEQVFDSGGFSTHTRKRFSYDAFLNTTKINNDGDVTSIGDESASVFEYAASATSKVRNDICRVSTYDANGALAAQNGLLYDGLALCALSKGNPTGMFQLVQSGQTSTISLANDAYGNVLTYTDALGNASKSQYDSQGQFRIKTTDPLGRAAQFAFDSRFGVPTQITLPTGSVEKRAYDEFGRLARVTSPGDESSPLGTYTLEYSPFGSNQNLRIRATETSGQAASFDTSLFYDGNLRWLRVEQEALNGRTSVVSRQFDGDDREVSRSVPHLNGDPGPVSATTFDALGRVLQVVDPLGTSTTKEYQGFETTITDRRGNPTVQTVDAFGNVTKVSQLVSGAWQTTNYKYDILSRLVQIVDAVGNTTVTTYNLAGWRTQLQDPTRGLSTFTFDANGRVLSEKNALGATTTYQYDAAGKLIKKILGSTEQYTYQFGTSGAGNGLLIHTAEPAGTTDMDYDLRGRVVTRKRKIATSTYITRYTYDSLGRLRNLHYPDGFFVDYTYGTDGRASRVTDDKGRVIVNGIEHNPYGAVETMLYANGATSAFTFDAEGKTLEMLASSTKQGTFEHEDYTYDPGRNVAQIADLLDGRLTQTFNYDELNRVTKAQTDKNSSYGTETYSYDAVGNLTQKGDLLYRYRGTNRNLPSCVIDRILAANTASIPPGSSNDPCVVGSTETPHAIRGTGESVHQSQVFSLSYDAMGSTVAKNHRRYQYDSEGHLTKVTEGTQTWLQSYYDAAGNRVRAFTQQADTIYVDGIYETESGQTRRIINVDGKVVATYASPGRAPLESEILSYWKVQPPNVRQKWIGIAAIGLSGILAHLLVMGLSARRRIERAWIAAIVREWCVGISDAFRGNKVRWAMAIVVSLVQVSLHAPPASATSLKANYTDDQRFYYHADQAGNTKFITNFEGMVHARRYYTPFGEQVVPPGMDGSLQNNISFNGQQLNRAQIPELYDFGARSYDPTFGRFMSADSIIKDPLNPLFLNRLAFAINNPLKYIDPSGHSVWSWIEDQVTGTLGGILVGILIVAVAAVLTIATAGTGTLAVAIVVGMAVGAVAGTIAAASLAGGHNFAAGLLFVLAGAAVGASAVASVGAAAVAGGAQGASAIAWGALTGALSGAAGGGFTALVTIGANGNFSGDYMLGIFLEGFAMGAAVGGALGAVGGAIGSIPGLDQYIGIDWAKAFPKVVAAVSVANGFASGENVSAYYYDKEQHLNVPPWVNWIYYIGSGNGP